MRGASQSVSVKAKFRILLFILPLLLISLPSLARAAGCDGANNCYIRAGATGAGNGSNWTNAYSGFGTGAGQIDPANMSRGVNYWLASGSYGGVTFSTADSGTAVITITGATAASHGPATDWQSSYAGQAVFGESSVTSDYWSFNGQSRGSDWRSGYSIKFWNKSNGSGASMALGSYQGGVTNMSFEYVEMEGTGDGFPNNTTADRCSVDNCGVWGDYALYESYPSSNVYVGHGYYHHTGNTQFQMNNTGAGGVINSGFTWEYNWVSYNHTGQNGQHDEAYSLVANNVTIRYNVYQDISGTGLITDASATNPAMSNWFVYGNLFFNDAAYLSMGQQYWLNTMDNGILAFGDGNGSPENMTGTILFANNTIANWNPAGVSCANSVYSTLPVSGVPGAISGTAKVIIENNLWYNAKCAYGNYASICYYLSCSEDYNASYAGSVTSADNWQTQATPAPHDYNVSSTTVPFVNLSASSVAGFELVSPDPFISEPGIALASPYNMDMLGITRGSNGTWDRGALQLGSGTTTATLKSIAVTPASTSIYVNGTQQFAATGTYSDSSTQDLTSSVSWSSSNTAAATIGSSGVAIGLAAGSTVISATSGTITGTGTLSVLQPTIQSIAVSPTNAYLPAGGQRTFTAIATYSNGTTQTLTSGVAWSSSNTSIATISSTGVATGIVPGTVTITAVYGSLSAATTLYITSPVLQSIVVTPTTPSILPGALLQFTATGTYSDGSTRNITTSVKWHSGNTAVATVNSSGVATGLAAGSCRIYAKLNTIVGYTKLTVQ